MDLISAIRSGKPFKRKHTETWFVITEDQQIVPLSGGCANRFGFGAIMAEDWEIKEKVMELTEDQIKSAFLKGWGYPLREDVLFVMLKDLGFKE